MSRFDSKVLRLAACCAGAVLAVGCAQRGTPAATPPAAPSATQATAPSPGLPREIEGDIARADAALKAANAWLALVDAGDYASSYTQAAANFRAQVKPDDWRTAALAARGPLGALKARTPTSAKAADNPHSAPPGAYEILMFSSSFAQRAQASEQVTLIQDSDGQWRVTGYFVK